MNCVKCDKPVEHIDPDWGPYQVCDSCQARFEADHRRQTNQPKDP